MRKRINSLMVSILLTITCSAQQLDSAHTAGRLRGFVIGSSATYTASLIGLNQLWYQDSERQSFRFFNDNGEWKQVDKLGHFFSAFHISNTTAKALQWCHLDQRKSYWWGAATGFIILLPIEIFDGYSEAYGASAGDLLANASGSLFFLGQSLVWNELRIKPKFSYRPTHFASQRPDVLGDTHLSRLLKDYNGQTYWLSVDMDKFIPFPKWLNLAVGYGANGMVFARDHENSIAGFDSYRQVYVGFDVDVTAIRTKSKTIKTLLTIVDMIKLPAPTVEFSRGKAKFHAFYF